jgi:hypothetical protein
MRLAATLIAVVLSACTMTNYGTKPQPVTGAEGDTFKFKTSFGGFDGGDSADRAVIADLDAFKKANGFASYRIVTRQFNAFPPGYEYLVRFSK